MACFSGIFGVMPTATATAAVCSIAACQLPLFVQQRLANCRCLFYSGMPIAAFCSIAACQLPLFVQ
jgi:hypothetical protein